MSETDKLLDHFSHKESVTIHIDGKCDDEGILRQELTRTVKLNPNVTHQIALVSIETSAYFPNVTEKNNKFFYSKNAEEMKTVELMTGAYEVEEYNEAIKALIKANGDDESSISIELIPTVARTKVILKNGYKVYFPRSGSWRRILGFKEKNLTTNGTHISDRLADLNPIQKVSIGCNLCGGSIGNKNKLTKGNELFSFPNSQEFGAPLTLSPAVLRRRELLSKEFDSIRLEFYSNDNEPITFLGSQITAEIVIFQV